MNSQQKYEQERRPVFDAHDVSESVYCSSDQQHQYVISSLCVKKQHNWLLSTQADKC